MAADPSLGAAGKAKIVPKAIANMLRRLSRLANRRASASKRRESTVEVLHCTPTLDVIPWIVPCEVVQWRGVLSE